MDEALLHADASLIAWLWVAFMLLMVFLLSGVSGQQASHEAAPRVAPLAHERFEPRFDRPESVTEPIGEYMGGPIPRSIFIQGREYFFDRVEPRPDAVFLDADERCISPGIVYRSG